MDTPAGVCSHDPSPKARSLGVPVSQLMRNLAEEMRKRRRATRGKAHKAPVKILFPLRLSHLPCRVHRAVLPAMLNLSDLF